MAVNGHARLRKQTRAESSIRKALKHRQWWRIKVEKRKEGQKRLVRALNLQGLDEERKQ